MRKKTDRKYVQLRLPLEGFSEPEERRAESHRQKGAVREALHVALKNCDMSREEIAEEMSRLTGDGISVHHLNNWVAESKAAEWRFPMEYAAAFTVVTGDYGVFQAALRGTGLRIITREEEKYLEFGRIEVEEKKKRKKKAALLADLGVK